VEGLKADVSHFQHFQPEVLGPLLLLIKLPPQIAFRPVPVATQWRALAASPVPVSQPAGPKSPRQDRTSLHFGKAREWSLISLVIVLHNVVEDFLSQAVVGDFNDDHLENVAADKLVEQVGETFSV